jgi:aminopeptidase N
VGLVTFYASRGAAQGPQQSSESLPEPEPSPEHSAKVTDVRLPSHLMPELYRLQLTPFIVPDNFTIRGRVEIRMKCIKAANNVTLHMADLLVQNDTVSVEQVDSGKSIRITGHTYDKDREFYITKLGESLEPGKVYNIKIDYTAYLKDNLKGFYRSVYKNQVTGQDEYIAVTQFQATDARRAFPCFDEPGIKARYDVSLGRLKTMSSMSNMPIERKGEVMAGTEEYVWDHYQQSVKMSTYLVAFVVSKFDYKETTREDNGVSRLHLFQLLSRCASGSGRSPAPSTRPTTHGTSGRKSSSSLRTIFA